MKKIILIILIIFSFYGCDKKDVATTQTQFQIVKSKIGKENMVLEIGSSSCQGCIKMKKLINEVQKDVPNLPIHVIDVYDDMKVFSFFNIKMIPTQVVINAKGEEVYRHIGGLSREELLSLVEISKHEK